MTRSIHGFLEVQPMLRTLAFRTSSCAALAVAVAILPLAACTASVTTEEGGGAAEATRFVEGLSAAAEDITETLVANRVG